MADDPQDEFTRRVLRRADRRARERRRRSPVWFGVSTFGIVGWSIAVPTLGLLALGIWLDRHVDAGFSWTISLLLAGIVLGCLNAWHWISEQPVFDAPQNGEENE